MHFIVFKSSQEGQWYWHLTGGNDEIIASSEGYHNKEDALRIIESIKVHASKAEVHVVDFSS